MRSGEQVVAELLPAVPMMPCGALLGKVAPWVRQFRKATWTILRGWRGSVVP
jgi:hypothetical protein